MDGLQALARQGRLRELDMNKIAARRAADGKIS